MTKYRNSGVYIVRHILETFKKKEDILIRPQGDWLLEKVGWGLNRVLINTEPAKVVQFFNTFKHALAMLILWTKTFPINQVIMNWENIYFLTLKFWPKIDTLLLLENLVKDFL